MHQNDGLEDKVLYGKTHIVNSHNNDVLGKIMTYWYQSLTKVGNIIMLPNILLRSFTIILS